MHAGNEMPSQTEPGVRTTVTIPAANYAQLQELARQNKVSVAWIVRDAVSGTSSRDTVTLDHRAIERRKPGPLRISSSCSSVACTLPRLLRRRTCPRFRPELICGLVGMSESFVRRSSRTLRTAQLADICCFLDQDAFQETLFLEKAGFLDI